MNKERLEELILFFKAILYAAAIIASVLGITLLVTNVMYALNHM